MRKPTDGDPKRQRSGGGAPATEELLRRYRRRPAPGLRDQLLLRHRATVEGMARQLALRLPPCVDPQDLVHAGIWGLLQAIDKYAPEKHGHAGCDQFATFMRFRVRGAMLDELRNMDWVPRLYRRRQRDRAQALERLRAALLREPSEHELAQELGCSLQALQRAHRGRVELQLVAPHSRDGDDDAGQDALEHVADAAHEPPIEAINRRELLAKIRQSLRPMEWRVLQLHYLEGMSGKEVARRLRLSASRICQIHGRVLDRLKHRLRAMAV